MKVTLEQWHMLSALEECGSYQAAAERLGKSQSTLSYGIKQLQLGLGMQLLEIQGRRAVLTESGHAVLRRARDLLDEAQALEAMTQDLAAGWESEIRLAVDMIFPEPLLFNALEAFAPQSRGSRIEVVSSTLSGTQDAIIHGEADVAVCGLVPIGFFGEKLLPIEFVPVACPEHPLCRTNVSEDALKKHRQLVVRDTGTKRNLDAGWLGAEQRWTVSSFGQSLTLVERGLAFAFLPRHIVQPGLDAGRLRLIELKGGMPGGLRRGVDCHLVFPDKRNVGPAAALFSQRLREACRA